MADRVADRAPTAPGRDGSVGGSHVAALDGRRDQLGDGEPATDLRAGGGSPCRMKREKDGIGEPQYRLRSSEITPARRSSK